MRLPAASLSHAGMNTAACLPGIRPKPGSGEHVSVGRLTVAVNAIHGVFEFEFEWEFYAQSASKAIFRARTYDCITYSVR